MSKSVIVALDVGTTNIKCIAFDQSANILFHLSSNAGCLSGSRNQMEYDPLLIWKTARELLVNSFNQEEYRREDIACIGISTQRGSTLLWNRLSGLPECNAISWQDLRTVEICRRIMEREVGDLIVERMGGPLIPSKSLGKLLWLFEERKELRKKTEQGLVMFGNLDSWVLWKLTGQKVHATDNSNASATHMVAVKSQQWDKELMSLLGIPLPILPEIKPSTGILGFTDPDLCGREIPICSLIADQQASLFGTGCVKRSMTKCTYGTGSFVLMNIGEDLLPLAKAAWNIDGQITYAIEGYGGATGLMTRWLFEEVLRTSDASEFEKMALGVNDSQRVTVVPAFSGLQAPFQDPHAMGMILGLSVGVGKNHIARAFLESIGMLCRAIIEDLQERSKIRVERLRVDGAASANDFLIQFQSDILGIPVERSSLKESTAAGAAFLAGLACGFWTMEDISELWRYDKVFEPKMSDTQRNEMYDRWMRAVEFSRAWGEG